MLDQYNPKTDERVRYLRGKRFIHRTSIAVYPHSCKHIRCHCPPATCFSTLIHPLVHLKSNLSSRTYHAHVCMYTIVLWRHKKNSWRVLQIKGRMWTRIANLFHWIVSEKVSTHMASGFTSLSCWHMPWLGRLTLQVLHSCFFLPCGQQIGRASCRERVLLMV